MLNSLQVCRALAALLVVLFHTSHGIFRLPKYFGYKPFGPVFDFGYAGVDFFFVLSGFIMMYIHAADLGQPHKLGSYLWKRFSRIYLPYWVAFTLILPVYFLVPYFGFGYECDPNVYLRAFFLFPHPLNQQVLGVAWTLDYEIWFYLLFGLLILNKRIGIAVLMIWMVGILNQTWVNVFPWSFLFSQMHLPFLAGIGVAVLVKYVTIPLPRTVAATGFILFVGTGLLDAYYGPLVDHLHWFGFILGSSLLLMGLVEAERSGFMHSPGWLVYLGNASYAIYLVHFLALSVLAKVTKILRLDQYFPGAVLFCLLVLGAMGCGCLFHHLVEHPLHQWARRFSRRMHSAVKLEEPVPEMISRAA